MISSKQGGTLLLLALLTLPSQLIAAPSPFDIDVKELDQKSAPVAPKAEKKSAKKKAAPAAAAPKSAKAHKAAGDENQSGYLRYTVRPGDHIFKILVGHFGMSNETAEKLIPEIIRVNNISNMKTLTVGRTLLIPVAGHQEHAARAGKRSKGRARKEEGSDIAAVPAAAPRAPETAPPAPLASAPASKAPGSAAAVPPAPALNAPASAAPVLPVPAPKPAAPAAPGAAAAPVVPKPTATTAARPMTTPVPPAVSALAPTPAPKAAPTVPAPAAPVVAPAAPVPAIPVVPQVSAWICSVSEQDPTRIVDSVMNALALHWSRNRIIQSEEGAANAYSIRVDRYFELNGTRYIVSIGENDPYSYTLLRLLEGAGYRVLMIGAGDDFKAVVEKLLRFVGLAPDFGIHVLQGGKPSSGFLVQQDGPEGRKVLITSEAVLPKQKWALPAGCGSR
jgi:hypothetical protein